MKKTGNRIKTVRCLLNFMWFRQIISAGNVRRQVLKLLSGVPAADEVNDQASGNGLLPGVLLPVKENQFPLLLFKIKMGLSRPGGRQKVNSLCIETAPPFCYAVLLNAERVFR